MLGSKAPFGKQQWTVTAGPRQAKDTIAVLSNFNRISKTSIVISGVVGGESRQSEIWQPFSEPNQAAIDAYNLVGDTFSWTITAENRQQIIEMATASLALLAKNLPVSDERITLDQQAENLRAAKQRQAEYEARKPVKWFSVTESAALIRKLLAVKFPGQKFSVRSDSYAGGASVDIRWTDGPTAKEVEVWTKPFEGRSFDGSIDLACSNDSWLLPDGSASYGYTSGTEGSLGYISKADHEKPHPDAIRVHFGSNYVFSHREMSEAVKAQLVAKFEQERGPYDSNKHYGDHYGSTVLHQMFSETSYYVAPASEERKDDDQPPTGIAISENQEKGGVEIRFAEKPAQSVIASLKSAGFRWSRFAQCWWHKKTEQALRFAAQLANEVTRTVERVEQDEYAVCGAD